MYRLRFIILAVVAASIATAGNYYRCYEYKANDFKVIPVLHYERVFIAVPKAWPKQEKRPLIMFFTDASGRHEKTSQYLGCVWDSTTERYRCGGECDAGEVMMRKDMSLSFDTDYKLEVDIPVATYQEEERSGLDLRQGVATAKAEPVTCPLNVERLFDPIRDGEYKDGPVLHVCYTQKKSHAKTFSYGGCMMSMKPCSVLGKQHFGKYPNEEDTYNAFLRCVDSKPLKQ
jgi:hypothetical protein